MINKKFEAGVQICLLILTTFAFSYFVDSSFQSLKVVSAQSGEGFPSEAQGGASQEQINEFKEAFPQLNDEEIQEMINTFGSVEGAREARESIPNDINNAAANGQVTDNLLNFLKFFNNVIPNYGNFGGNSQLQNLFGQDRAVYTCPLDNDNAICQQYKSSECDAACQENCITIDVSQNDLPADNPCAIGICYDPEEGTCQDGQNGGGSPRAKCEEFDGEWYAFGNPAADSICKVGCCILGEESQLSTHQGCLNLASNLGTSLDQEGVRFDPEITNEYACIRSAKGPIEGACVVPNPQNPDGKNDCKFVDYEECFELTGNPQSFYLGTLCSHPLLNTTCSRQNTTNCVDGRDEVYWFDSCGNRENIYSIDADRSWNGGLVLPKDNSCPLGDANNPVKYQGVCGNCNSVKGTMCGNKTEQTDNTPRQEITGQNVVCRDMGCYQKDILGNLQRVREHGESWCAYNSQVGMFGPDFSGLDGFTSFLPQNPISGLLGGQHSTDTPGSRHFRVYCQNGEIITSQCDDFRNAICVEQKTPKGVNAEIVDPELINKDFSQFINQLTANVGVGNLFGGTFSQATCRPSRWAECFAYNPDQNEARLVGMAGKASGKILEAKLALTCGRDPDCFVKKVDMTSSDEDTFKFSVCAPRYPPGSDLSGEVENSGAMCNFGSKVCTAIWIKEESAPFGAAVGAVEWKCKSNCDCVEGDDPDSAKPSQKFIKEMNDACISMGDCGHHVNYAGVEGGSKGYQVRAESCDIEKERCEGGGLSQLTGGLGGGSGGLSGLGFGGGSNPHPEDAIALPGDFIQTDGGFLNDVIGESGNGFFDDLFGAIPGLDQLTSAIDGLEAEDGTPNTDYGTDVGAGAGIGLFGGTSGSIYSAIGSSAGATGTSLAATAQDPVSNVLLRPESEFLPAAYRETAGSSVGELVTQPNGEQIFVSGGTRDVFRWPDGSYSPIEQGPNSMIGNTPPPPVRPNTPASLDGSVPNTLPVPPGVGSAAISVAQSGWHPPLLAPADPVISGFRILPSSDALAAGVPPDGYLVSATDPAFTNAWSDFHGIPRDFVGPPAPGSPVPTGPVQTDYGTIVPEYVTPDASGGTGGSGGGTGGSGGSSGGSAGSGGSGGSSGGTTGNGGNLFSSITGTQVAAFSAGIVAGAAAGAVMSYILDVTGIGAGLSPVTSFTLTAGTSFVAGSSANAAVTVALKDADLVLAPSPIGIAILVVVAYTIIMSKILGVGEMRKTEVSFTCQAWEPPQGGNCESCGEDALSDGQNKFPCSRYSCEALGQNCVFAEDSEREGVGGVCISSSPGDVAAPILTDKSDEDLSEGFTYYDLNDNPNSATIGEGFKIRKNNVGCIDQFERMEFGFKLNEFGICRMSAISPGDIRSQVDFTNADPAQDSDDIVFELMPMISGGLKKEHKVVFTSRDLFDSLGRTEPLINEQNDITLYIACEDYQGADNVNNPFEIKFCVNKRDLTAVQFLDSSGLESLIRNDVVNSDLNIRVGEAAQCKWAYEDFEFESEGNNFDGDCREINGEYICTAGNIQVNNGDNRICVKCKDHPEWQADERAEGRNVNSECWWTTVRRTEPLKITRLSPGEGSTMTRGREPVEFNLEVETSGGVDGSARCRYKIGNSGQVPFQTTGTSLHTQAAVQLNRGVHTVNVDCTDNAGNTATESSTFSIFVDETPPSAIVRDVTFGSVIVATTESATCAYTNGPVEGRQSACEFSVEEIGEVAGVYEMSSSEEGLEHSAGVIANKPYNIKCRDEFNNEPLGCNINGFKVI